VFRIALADLNGVLPVMKVSDRLTELAQAVLERVLNLARDQLSSRYGSPGSVSGAAGPVFGIIGYGKLGGLELGYGSDLDIVFVYERVEGGQTDGARPLDNSVFFTRLAQRIVHMLSTQTRSGYLYEVDTRLRPSGKSGLLVSDLGAFATYQMAQAWTWEHQALLRARVVAGDDAIGEWFDEVRRRVLCQPRDPAKLRTDIARMRERMRAELDNDEDGLFDLKQGEGGIADIEFLVQYFLLRNAAEHPDIVAWSDNIRQLVSLADEHLLSPETAETLTDTYRSYRKRLHRLMLDGAGKRVSGDEFVAEREFVRELWLRELGGARQ
jgi:glutamate-ammonia-ligase adenylyltransferase